MTQLGMDAGVVRNLADQMDRLAGHLESLVGSVDGSVHQASSMWFGSDAGAFHEDWTRGHRPALTALAHDIRSLAGTARSNAVEQDSASGVTDGARGGGGLGRIGLPFPWRDGLNGFRDGLDRVNLPRSVVDQFQRWNQLLHHAPHWMQGRLLHHPVFWDHKVVPLLHDIGDSRNVQHLLHLGPVEGAGHVIAGSTDVLGKIGSGVGVTSDVVDAFHHAHQGDVGAELNDVSNATSTTLKSFKNPAVYLSGVVVSEYTDIANQAAKIDWHQGLPAPTPANLYHDYIPAVWDSVTSMPSHIWKWIS